MKNQDNQPQNLRARNREMKNPAVPNTLGATGYLNVRNCSLSYSLVNPTVPIDRNGECARYAFQ